MKVGDLVSVVREWTRAGAKPGMVGIVMGRQRTVVERSERRAPLVKVLMSGTYKLFEYRSLEVIND
jgi:hypothetical protein